MEELITAWSAFEIAKEAKKSKIEEQMSELVREIIGEASESCDEMIYEGKIYDENIVSLKSKGYKIDFLGPSPTIRVTKISWHQELPEHLPSGV